MLTQKQEDFCLAYIETRNASEAYRRAYAAEKMKPESINRKAKELMDSGKIAARLGKLTAGHDALAGGRVAVRHVQTPEAVRRELGHHAS